MSESALSHIKYRAAALGKRHTVVLLMTAVNRHPEQLRAGPRRATRATPWPHIGFPTWHTGGRDLRAATGKNLYAGHITEQGASRGGRVVYLPCHH